mmetsp:Transcript_3328/g.10320  ORF Transcript_3328/g.10320 Transcript_3328/m.10320 type:complete len:495 (-) Transcript_3328:76-1560(-)
MERPSMVAVLQEGEPRRRATETSSAPSRVQEAVSALKWRQRYRGAKWYVLELASGRVLALEQRTRGEAEGLGTGGTVWPAAHVLARYLERRVWPRGDMRGLRVLELGAGTACAGIASAALGARRVVATDLDGSQWLARRNAVANGVADVVESAALAWGRDAPPEADVVLASECVLPQLFPLEPLADTLAAALRAVPGSVGLVAYEHRVFPAYDPRTRFEALLAERGVSLAVVPRPSHDPLFSAADIEIWELAAAPRPARRPALLCRAWGEDGLSRFDMAGDLFELAEPRHRFVGAALWPSSLAAARYCLAEIGPASTARPKRVLELGAGCGLAAVVLARLGHLVTATDLPDVVDAVLQPNLDRALPKTLRPNVRAAPHAWGHLDSLPDDSDRDPFDLVLCSDCAYDSTVLQPLLASLAALFRARRHRPPDLLILNEQRTALDALLGAIRRHPDLSHLHLHNLHLAAAHWTIDCLPPHRQPPPVAAFRSNAVVAL